MAGTKTAEEIIYFSVHPETNEVIERPYTADELSEMKIRETEYNAEIAEIEAKKQARQSALAKLAELGLTAEEIAAI